MNEPGLMILLLINVIVMALLVYYGWGHWRTAVIAAAIGFAPMILNITADLIGTLLGCYVHGPIEPCAAGPIDIGWLLNVIVTAGLLFALTWSCAVASIILLAPFIIDWIRRQLAR